MKTIFKYFVEIMKIDWIFILIVFMLPYSFALLGYRDFDVTFSLLGGEILSISVGDSMVRASVGIMGLIIFSLVAFVCLKLSSMIGKKVKELVHGKFIRRME